MSKKVLGIIAGLAIALAAVVVPVVNAEEMDLGSMDNDALIALIQQLLAGSTSTTTSTTTTTTSTTTSFAGIPAGFQFDRNLSQGMTGDDVKYLQIVLNSDPATVVATSGTGSAGSESTYFGSLTKNAVIKFQNKYASEVLTPLGLTAGTGYVGASTRAKLNEILASGTSTTTTTSVSSLSAVDCVTQGYAWNGTICVDPNATVTDPSSLSAVDCVTQGYAWNGTSCYDPSSSTSTPSTPTVTPVEGAGMTVALASDSPSGTTLVTGQAIAPIAKFVFTNKDSVSAKVTSIELQRIGVSADDTLADVYLFDGETRLTDAASVNQGVITFNNSAEGVINLPAGNSVEITVVSDIAAGTSGQIVGVSLSGVTSNVEVTSTLPIQGGTQTIAQADLAAVTVGTPTPTSPTTTDPQDGVLVWQSVFNVATRDVNMSRLALRQINSIETKDLQNFILYIDGEEVAQVDALDSNGVVTFVFDKLIKSGNRTFKVTADVISGSSRYIQMSLRNSADVSIKDSQYGVDVMVTGVPASASTIQVNPGQVTVKKSSESPSGNIALDASSVTLGTFELKAYGEPIKITTLKAGVAISSAATNLRNGKIFINGAQYGTTATLDDDTSYTVNFTAQPGETNIVEVVADITANSGTAIAVNDTIQVSLLQGDANGERKVSLGLIDVPGGNVPANSLTVAQGSLSLTKASNYGNQTAVFPQSDYKVGEWTLSAGSTESVDLYTFTVNFKRSAATVGVRDAYLVINGESTTVKSSPTVATGEWTGDNTWSVSKTVAKTGTMTIALYADIENNDIDDDTPTLQGRLTVSGTGEESGQTVESSATVGQIVTYAKPSITVTRGAASPASANIADEGTVQSISYQIETRNDAYTINGLVIQIADPSVVSEVKVMDGSTVLQTKPGGNTVTFAGLGYQIPANSKKTLSIAMTLSEVGQGYGKVGANIRTAFDLIKVIPQATGIETNNTTAVTAGNSVYVYRTIPTITMQTLPSSTLTAGTKTLAKFKVAADESSSIAWMQVAFSVTRSVNGSDPYTAPTVASWKVYRGQVEVAGTPSCSADITAENANTSAICTFVADAAEEIAAGGSETYEIKASISGTITTNDYVTTSIQNPTNYQVVGPEAALAAVVSSSYKQGGGTLYTDTVADDAVTATDVRRTPMDSYAAAGSIAGGGSFGTVTPSIYPNDSLATGTFQFTFDGTDTWTPSYAGWTVVSAETEANGFTATSSIDGSKLVVVVNTAVENSVVTLVITKTDNGYAAGTEVEDGDTDIGVTIAAVSTAPSFIWSDMSAPSHSTLTDDWATDYLVKNLPTDTWTLTR